MVYNSDDIMKAKTKESDRSMPWKESSKAMLRQEFVDVVLSKQMTKSQACREFGISRPTGDKWLARSLAGESLDDRSRAPLRTANRISPEMEALVVAYRSDYPALGAVKIHRMMEDKGLTNLPSPSTINAIFKRHNLITKEASIAATPYQSYEKNTPNEMWQSDFKGNFEMMNGQRCHPLCIIDDCSRFNVCSQPKPDETLASVQPSVELVFREYGLPRIFLCDNGNPWGVAQSTGFTRFEVWLMDLGILTVHGRPLHPQTQGKIERFNSSLKREHLKYVKIADMEDAARELEKYRQFYNWERPHRALDLDTPGSRYKPSERRYPERITPWEYPSEYELRTIKSTGYFTYRGQGYFLSEALGERTVAVKESSKKGCITLCYRQFKIARINLDKRVFDYKRIYLAEGDPRFAPPAK
jgi:transposase InsO family protein